MPPTKAPNPRIHEDAPSRRGDRHCRRVLRGNGGHPTAISAGNRLTFAGPCRRAAHAIAWMLLIALISTPKVNVVTAASAVSTMASKLSRVVRFLIVFSSVRLPVGS